MLHYMKKVRVRGNVTLNEGLMRAHVVQSETLQPAKLSPADAERFAADPQPENHGSHGKLSHTLAHTPGLIDHAPRSYQKVFLPDVLRTQRGPL